MRNTICRRGFLQSAAAAGVGLGLNVPTLGSAAPRATSNANRLGWRLACCAYSFNKLSFYETIDKVRALGLGAIEGFVWQRLSPEKPKVLTNAQLSAADRREMKLRLADADMRLVSTYCNKLEEPDASRQVFEFAKELGMEFLVAEPPTAAYDMLEKLCNEYQISLAVHNHPQPSPYWSPDVFLERSQGRGPRIGVCADTGHWCRSNLEPVVQLKRLQGRVVSFHLKDVDTYGDKKAECVPWGTGKGRIPEILVEMKRQGFKGVFGIEYEPYHPENFERIRACGTYFEKVAGELCD